MASIFIKNRLCPLGTQKCSISPITIHGEKIKLSQYCVDNIEGITMSNVHLLFSNVDFQFCQPKFGALPVLHYYPSSIICTTLLVSMHFKSIYAGLLRIWIPKKSFSFRISWSEYLLALNTLLFLYLLFSFLFVQLFEN